MNISSVGQTAFQQNYAVAVAKKSQEQTQANGQAAVALIQSANQRKLQEGQTINVMA